MVVRRALKVGLSLAAVAVAFAACGTLSVVDSVPGSDAGGVGGDADTSSADAGDEPPVDADGGACGAGCSVAFDGLVEPTELGYGEGILAVATAGSSGQVYAYAPADGGAPSVVATSQGAHLLKVFGGVVYWIAADGALHASSAAGDHCVDGVFSYAFLTNRICYAVVGSLDTASPPSAFCGSPGTTASLGAWGLAADDATFFVGDNGMGGGSIRTCTASCSCSGGLQLVGNLQSLAPSFLTADDEDRVYYTLHDPATELHYVLKSAADGGAIATGQLAIKGVSTYLGSVYWTDRDEGTVMRSKESNPPVVLASGLASPYGIAATPDGVYVAESGAGRVIRLDP